MNPFEEALIAGFVSGMEKVAGQFEEPPKGTRMGVGSGSLAASKLRESKEKEGAGTSAVSKAKAKGKSKGKSAPKGWFAKRVAELKGHGKGLVKGFKDLPSKGISGKGAGYRRVAAGLLGGAGVAAGAAGGAGLMAALRKRKEEKETA